MTVPSSNAEEFHVTDFLSEREALRQSAAEIIEHPDKLALFATTFAKVVAGETANAKLLYLVATSRLFDKTMHAAIKGTSAGGKSEIRKRVLDFFPPESVVSFTSLSEKALFYLDGELSHKILSMGEATATDEQTFQDYVLRELMSEGRIRYPVAQKVGKDIKTIIIDKNGPVAFMVTTTRNKLHPENETRMLSLEIDDSDVQTEKVLSKVAQVEGLNHGSAQIDCKPWQDFQRWLELGETRAVVPFASAMVKLIPPKAVRLRRDVGQVLRAVKAHALLHRGQRTVDDSSGEIIADIAHDYATVRELMHSILAEGSGVAVKKEIAATIKAVEQVTAGLSETEGATAQEVAKIIKLDKSAAWRRLSAARNEGFVVNLEQRQGMPGKYRATKQAANIEPKIDILPAQETLQQAFNPPKPVQPCNREEIPETDQADNGCKGACNPDAIVVQPVAGVADACNPFATALATVKSMNGQAELLPVARLHANPGGTGKVTASSTAPLCLQCGGPLGPGSREITVCSTSDGQLHPIHEDCLGAWQTKGPPIPTGRKSK
jgi:hypothetical protein